MRGEKLKPLSSLVPVCPRTSGNKIRIVLKLHILQVIMILTVETFAQFFRFDGLYSTDLPMRQSAEEGTARQSRLS